MGVRPEARPAVPMHLPLLSTVTSILWAVAGVTSALRPSDLSFSVPLCDLTKVKRVTGSKWEREMGWDREMTAGRTRTWVPVATRTRSWHERCSLLHHSAPNLSFWDWTALKRHASAGDSLEDCRSCLDCSHDNGCVRCPERLFLFLQRDGMSHHGVCLQACPPGHYGQRGKQANTCMRCKSVDCEQCFSRDFCTRCRPGLQLHKGRCLTRCPPHTFRHHGDCVAQKRVATEEQPSVATLHLKAVSYSVLKNVSFYLLWRGARKAPLPGHGPASPLLAPGSETEYFHLQIHEERRGGEERRRHESKIVFVFVVDNQTQLCPLVFPVVSDIIERKPVLGRKRERKKLLLQSSTGEVPLGPERETQTQPETQTERETQSARGIG
ncbi:R-spondin-2 [Merluccius polli]|uniref:R-spondin-2 n=1 Tax=Merluccius polli TaxID=89951 RepID=A0AA47PDL1_MERPO|nr:R-spondin-2 [Merluccius polli]